MVNNTRALQLLANAAEYDTKLSAIKRLRGFLERGMAHVLLGIYNTRGAQVIERPLIDGIRIEMMLWQNKGLQPKFNVYKGTEWLRHDSEFDLVVVRILHDHMDDAIELAEKICKECDRTAEFDAIKARFGM